MHKNLDNYQGDYQTLRYDANYAVVFTKTESDSLPITQTKVEKRPCLDPSWNSDFLYEGRTNEDILRLRSIDEFLLWNYTKEFYPLEKDLWSFDTGNQTIIWRCQNEDEFDPRY